jgi:hypothetical protein
VPLDLLVGLFAQEKRRRAFGELVEERTPEFLPKRLA